MLLVLLLRIRSSASCICYSLLFFAFFHSLILFIYSSYLFCIFLLPSCRVVSLNNFDDFTSDFERRKEKIMLCFVFSLHICCFNGMLFGFMLCVFVLCMHITSPHHPLFNDSTHICMASPLDPFPAHPYPTYPWKPFMLVVAIIPSLPSSSLFLLYISVFVCVCLFLFPLINYFVRVKDEDDDSSNYQQHQQLQLHFLSFLLVVCVFPFLSFHSFTCTSVFFVSLFLFRSSMTWDELERKKNPQIQDRENETFFVFIHIYKSL